MSDAPAPDPSVVADLQSQIQNRDQAQADLTSTIKDFNPPENTTPSTFNETAPTDQFGAVVGIAPLLAALGAIGGKFGNVHGVAMLESTNAMMQGIVKGSAEQYQDARKQYEVKYDQWHDQQKTWNDTYKAYMQAYKGRVDAQQRAVAGANAAVGISLRGANMTEKQVADAAKLHEQIRVNDAKIRATDAKVVTDRIKADSQASRAATAAREADLKVQQLREKIKTDDANTLTATMRSLKGEADTILKQYPASAGKKPPDVEAKLQGIRESMDLVNEQLKRHSEKSYTENKALYEQARTKIAAGGDPVAVKKRLADLGLDPELL
jgi:hypothetical protein